MRTITWLVRSVFVAAILAIPMVSVGCANAGAPQESTPETAAAESAPAELTGAEEDLPPELQIIMRSWTGDLDGMAKRRHLRALVIYSKSGYFLDGMQQRGITYEALKEFEKFLNKRLRMGRLRFHVVFLPVRRDELIPALEEGRGDLAAANLTITPERQEIVDFSIPLFDDVSEVLVTGPAAPDVSSWEDLTGKEIHVRKSSSYFESLQRFNAKRRTPIPVRAADENLEDEDLLEMVNVGLIPAIIVDSHKAKFWNQIFDDITVHPNLTVNTGGQIGWAFRKNSPQLKEAVDEFAKGHREGTLFGNILLKRYLRSTKWVTNPTAEAEMKRFRATIDFFQKYADQYELDWLLLTAQGYQESRLNQNLKSSRGAVGVMQLLPSTAAGPPISIRGIDELDNNVHAGVKYLRHIIDQYLKDEPMDEINRGLFAFASYNAGPNRIQRLRKEAEAQGLDPNIWFRNVELIAAKRIGRETVQYVSNIYKYYLAYQLIMERHRTREAVKERQ